ncbi:hypothetical protein VU08_02525 [Desulfobulbus sp. F5]|nr:hypothetical protein [Desulfobulbus sp. F5]
MANISYILKFIIKMPPFIKRSGVIVANIFLFLIVVAVAIICSEVFLRWYYRDVLSSASGVDYFHNRSYPLFAKEKNGLNLRGKNFEIENHHSLRIVVMGDSFTYGQGVYPYEKRYTEQMELLFKKEHPDLDVEFINVGICGMDLPDYNNKIVNFVTALHPDFVLYQWYVNDMEITRDWLQLRIPQIISNNTAHRFFIENSVLYFILQRGWSQIRAMSGQQLDYTEYLVKRFSDPENKYSIAAKKELDKLFETLDRKNIPHGIVLFPDFNTKKDKYRLAFLHEQVHKVCKEHHVDYLDLTETYSKYDDNIEKLWANIFDHHPSALAHRIAAEKIVDFFGNKWQQMALKNAYLKKKE